MLIHGYERYWPVQASTMQNFGRFLSIVRGKMDVVKNVQFPPNLYQLTHVVATAKKSKHLITFSIMGGTRCDVMRVLHTLQLTP